MIKKMNIFPYAIALLILSSSFYAHAMERQIITTNKKKEVLDKLFRGKKLHQAAAKGSMGIVKKLIKSGVDVNFKDDSGWTALMWATIYNHHFIVKLLLQAGADVNCQDRVGCTVLMKAAQNGHVKIISDLIQSGANPTINMIHTTALSLAAAGSYYTCCKNIIAAMLKQTTAEINSLV